MPPTLTHVFDLKCYRPRDGLLSFNSTRGDAPRYIAPIGSGHLKTNAKCTTHPVFTAELTPGCADWLRLNTTTGTGYLDARLQFQDCSDPSSVFFCRLEGTVKMDDEIRKIFEWRNDARTTRSEEHYSFMTPVFEVSKEEHKWMEERVFVGHGHYVVEREDGEVRQAVEYEVYEVGSG